MRLVLAALSILAAVSAAAATLENGDFEAVRDSQPLGWETRGPGVAVRALGSALWNHSATTFSSGEYRTLRPYLRIQTGTGTVWFDHVAISNLAIANPSFEEGDANTLAGWGQDEAGKRTFRDTAFATDGRASARVTSADGNTGRIWQDIPCEPNTEYVFSFDWRAEDLAGDAYAEVYGMSPAGEHGQIVGQTAHFPSLLVEQFGKSLCELSLSAPGETGLTQRVTLSPEDQKRAWGVTARFRVSRMDNGSASLSVQTGPNADSTLVREVTAPAEAWQTLSLNFIPAGGDVQIAIRAKGNAALAYVDNVTLGEPSIAPAPKVFEALPVAESFPVPEKLALGISGKTGGVVAGAFRLFSESLKEQTGSVVLPQDPLRADEPGVQLIVAPGDRMRRDPESYSLRVGRDRVTITSADERGALYGLMTLLALVQKAPTGGYVFLAASIDDAPDLPFRASYVAGAVPDQRTRGLIDRFARLRLNAAVFEDGVFYLLDDPGNRRQVQELFAYCREMGVEPIPELQSFGWAHHMLAVDPNIAEGMEASDERVTLRGTDPAALAHPNVIRTESTDVLLTDEGRTQVFEEGRDYEVLPGEMRHVFTAAAAPFRIRRMPDSRIPDGGTVLVGYDYVSRLDTNNTPYCPNEPRVYRIMRRAIRNTICAVHPRYIHIGHDEPMQMGTDSRCRKAGRSNAENFAKDVWRIWHMAKAQDPDVRLMMFEDAINPYHNGYVHKDPTAPAADMLPKDVIQCIWFYGPADPLYVGWDSLQFFGQKGYTMTGSPWYDPLCARRWSIVCKRARHQGLPCIGTFYTSWAERWDALDEAAQSAWRVPEG